MESTIYSVNDGGLPLHNFNDTTVTEILITPPTDRAQTNWVVHGKVVLGNLDGNPQNASAWLVLMVGDTPTIIDRADVRIDQYGNTVSICLLAVFQAKQLLINKEIEVELHCQTYQGHVQWAKLVAMSTDSATSNAPSVRAPAQT
jgi:hypothetical protein